MLETGNGSEAVSAKTKQFNEPLFSRCLLNPDNKFNQSQRKLIEKHGTPTEFAIAVWSMIGEISVDEAQAAVRKYDEEFNKLS